MIWNIRVDQLKGKKDARNKSTQFLNHLLGHEGPNSLISALIKVGYATELSSGSQYKLGKTIIQLSIDVVLTQKGVDSY